MKKRSSAEMQKIIQSHSGEAKQTALRFTRDEAAAEKITREALLYSSKDLLLSEKKFYKKFMRRTGKLCGEYIKNTSFAEKDGSSSNLSEAAIAGACRGLYFTERRKKFCASHLYRGNSPKPPPKKKISFLKTTICLPTNRRNFLCVNSAKHFTKSTRTVEHT